MTYKSVKLKENDVVNVDTDLGRVIVERVSFLGDEYVRVELRPNKEEIYNMKKSVIERGTGKGWKDIKAMPFRLRRVYK